MEYVEAKDLPMNLIKSKQRITDHWEVFTPFEKRHYVLLALMYFGVGPQYLRILSQTKQFPQYVNTSA